MTRLATTLLSIIAGLFASIATVDSAAQDDDQCVELEGTPPGLYVTVDQSQVYLIKDGKVVELDPGEAAYASETELTCLNLPPTLLEWPCGTAEALSRQRAPTYTADALPVTGAADEVARRYFEDNEVLGPPIEWLNGDVHGNFDADELGRISTAEYWYLPGGPDPFASPKRPRAQLVALFWSTKQAVLDGNTLQPLRDTSADGEVPVVFVFHEDDEVPVSFFGDNVTLGELADAFFQRGIKVAPVPVWYTGDHHLRVSVREFEQLFDIPELEDISPAQVELHSTELEAHGFTKKPISVSVLGENRTLVVDQPERVRVASALGFDAIPTVLFYYTGTSHLGKCGVPFPQTSVVGGATSAEETQETVTPPPELPEPERRASGS
jgi:hypothetical protein